MPVTIKRNKQSLELQAKAGETVSEILKKLNANNETLIFKVNEKLCHSSKKLKDGDNLEIIDIIYGG